MSKRGAALLSDHKVIFPALAGVAMLAAVLPAQAQSIDDDLSTCTGINCQSVQLTGNINAHKMDLLGGSAATIPRIGAGSWVMPVRAGLQECLRLDVLSQTHQMEMTVVSPSLVIWRAISGGTCRSCPVVKINGTNQSGYYVVVVNHYQGSKVDGSFKIAYGRYPKNNPNCAAPTPGLM